MFKMASMEERIARLENAVSRLDKLEKDNQLIFEKLNMLLGDTNMERFYQRYLEKKYGATHSKGMFGITDIETDDKIIEIKRWDKYKEALGQILSYTSRLHSKGNTPNTMQKKPVVYFFGDKPKHIDRIISLFIDKHINVFYLYVTLDNEVVEEELICNHANDEFSKWLQERLEYSKEEVLQLSEVSQLYYGKSVGPRIMTRMKTKIEDHVNYYFPYVHHKYQKGCINGRHYRGWLHMKLKDIY